MSETVTPPTGLVFGRVPPPTRLREEVIVKPAGWSALGPRTTRGVCLHRTLGGPIATTGDYFRTFDARSDDGGHGWNALTDWGVGQDGLVLRWNADGVRSPHANGPVQTLEGDAVAFLARYGAVAVNRDLESIEREGRAYDTPLTPALVDATVELIAWRMDRALIPWDVWPRNRDGVQAIYWHGEFGPKDCPGPAVRARTGELIERVGARLKAFQTRAAPAPLPAPPPPVPPSSAPSRPILPGLDETLARAWFGNVVAGGRVYAFDPDGPVSRLWLAAGRERGEWPRLTAVETLGERRYFRFANGFTLWTAPGQDARVLRG